MVAAWKGGGRGKGVLLRGGSDDWGEWWWSGRKSRRAGLVGCVGRLDGRRRSDYLISRVL